MAAFLSSSRYIAGTYDIDGKSVPIAVRRYGSPSSYTVHLSREGESFDLLATKSLNDPSRWWEIADINPVVPFPDVIPPATRVRIPRK